MALASRLILAWKALTELGPGQVVQFAWYKALLRSGYLRWATKDAGQRADNRPAYPASHALHPLLSLPNREMLRRTLSESGVASLLSEADEIISGRVRLFGGEPVPLVLRVPGPLPHWTEYELGSKDPGDVHTDIKFTWEAGRFGWAYTLGRAYYLSQDERYSQCFWGFTETFLETNPPYLGPHWVSAQEVAFRLIALVFCSQVFAASTHTTDERQARLSASVEIHAKRIPPSLAYARAQNNNHLLVEAAGLYTAGLALPEHPQARGWRDLGRRWLEWGLQHQIDEDGTYIQHSSNYHRLMLQIAMWVEAISRSENRPFSAELIQRLALSTRWLLALVDPLSGRAPNLGPNDGAYIQPLTICPFHDYRPVLQAAGAAFLGEWPFPAGTWDELSLWFGDREQNFLTPNSLIPNFLSPHVLRITPHASWAYFRIARFRSRPGHADQLHLDLWWRGINLAQDAGTYSYNAPPPWENSLARTCVHNTLSVNGQDQMTRSSRFLWLDWAQAQLIGHEKAADGTWERLAARHDGYRRLGLLHQRTVTAFQEGRWQIEDIVLKVERLNVESPQRNNPTLNLQPRRSIFARKDRLTCNLHWFMPDWEWEIIEKGESRVEIGLLSPYGNVTLEIWGDERTSLADFSIVRAGQLLYGSGEVEPFHGWVSPTYGQKLPALSLSVVATGVPPLSLTTSWLLPSDQEIQ